jgi:hypothetical protein
VPTIGILTQQPASNGGGTTDWGQNAGGVIAETSNAFRFERFST